jgi:hypothetical protein
MMMMMLLLPGINNISGYYKYKAEGAQGRPLSLPQCLWSFS